MSNLSWMMSPNNFLWACHGLSLSFYILQDFKRMFSPFKDPCATPRAALSPFTRGAEDGLVCSFLLLNTTSVLFQYLPLPHVVQKVTMSPASMTDPDLRTPILSNECLVKNKNKQTKKMWLNFGQWEVRKRLLGVSRKVIFAPQKESAWEFLVWKWFWGLLLWW